VLSLFQTAAGGWHIPSILLVAAWLAGTLVTGGFMFANLKVNRDDRVRSFEEELRSAAEASAAQARINELEEAQRPRTISAEQRQLFIESTKAGPFGPVYLLTRTAFPNKEQEDFTMQLRRMLDAAGFGTGGNDITNGFNTGVDPGKFLLFVSHSDTPPPYFTNVASALHKLGLISPDVPIAVKNPNAKPGMLYLFIPEK
jgi:hypothetical protein